MPRAGWVALGAVVVALVVNVATSSSTVAPRVGEGMPGLATPAAAFGALALAAALGALGARRLTSSGRPEQQRAGRTGSGRVTGRAPRQRLRGPVLAGTVGGCLLAVRFALGTAVEPPVTAALPDEPGPWRATVESVGSPRSGAQSATLRLETPGSPTLVATLPRYPVIVAGDAVVVDGSVQPPSADGYGTYLRRIGAVGSLRARSLAIDRSGLAGASLLETLRQAGGDGLARVLPEPEAGLAAGILIGLRERVDRALAADFTTAGVSHVVAISGWNIALVGGAVAAVLRRASRRSRSIATLGAIAAYTLFAGASASVVRAALMATVVLVARETGRRGGAATALAWAATILLAVEPSLVLDPGFQLSALATAGLIAWSTPLSARLGRIAGGRLPAWLVEGLGVSTAAQAATLPVVLATFGRLSLVSPVANLAIVPLVPAAMGAGGIALLAGIGGMVGLPAIAMVALALPAWLTLTAIVLLVRVAATVPFASLAIEPPWNWAAAGVSAALVAIAATARGRALAAAAFDRLRAPFGAARERRPVGRGERLPPSEPRLRTRGPGRTSEPARHRLLRPSAVAVGLALAMSGVALAARPPSALRIAVLDVGQGDAILVEGRQGGRLLVDAGPDPESLLARLDERLAPWDRRLDVVVVTHPHEDHLGGLPVLLERYRVGRVLATGQPGDGPAWEALGPALARSGRRVETMLAGDALSLDGTRLTALWPPRDRIADHPLETGREVNDTSIVLLGQADGRAFLLLGDAEDDVDANLLATGLGRVDFVKVAHHGSRTANSAALLAALRPTIAAVSVGNGNRYGHPAASTIGRLEADAGLVRRTDRDGTIEVTLARGGVAIRTSRRAVAESATPSVTASLAPALHSGSDG